MTDRVLCVGTVFVLDAHFRESRDLCRAGQSVRRTETRSASTHLVSFPELGHAFPDCFNIAGDVVPVDSLVADPCDRQHLRSGSSREAVRSTHTWKPSNLSGSRRRRHLASVVKRQLDVDEELSASGLTLDEDFVRSGRWDFVFSELPDSVLAYKGSFHVAAPWRVLGDVEVKSRRDF